MSVVGATLPHLDPVPGLRDPRARLLLTSAALLFTELLLIRWIPSTVKYVGYFSNFLLMASFLGIGLGILVGRKGRKLPLSPFALLLFLIAVLTLVVRLDVKVSSPDEIMFGVTESSSADVNFLVLPLVFALVTLVMAALALPLGPLLKSQPPLQAYAFDISGSMLGIAGFALCSYLWTPSAVWFGIVAVLLLLLALGNGLGPWSPVTGMLMVGVVALAILQTTSVTTWSPYYRIQTYPVGQMTAIAVDGIPHQGFGPTLPLQDPYDQIYRWFPGRTYGNVLVIGAGSGNDVAVALARGAGHVDAVEIDPAILHIGLTQNPLHPFDDPRVTRYNNDGRAFLRTTTAKYDLVIFALPDSLTLVSSTGNLRLESFLFTDEAFASVRDHLNPGGVFVMYNYYREPWLVTKLGTMLRTTFGTDPILRTSADVRAVLADGPAVAALGGGAPPGDSVDPLPRDAGGLPSDATDDWPFLYLRTGTIPSYYLLALAMVLAFAVIGVGGGVVATRLPLREGFSPHFFVLGSAFMLLETRSLVSFSLLFGTTWLVNAMAFFAILASVLVAILVNARLRIRRSGALYVALFGALGVAFLLPPEQLLFDPAWLRYLLAGLVAFAPVFVANLIFTYSFRDTKIADMAFASNLVGAMFGGVLEYMALISGYRFLLIAVALLYFAAWLFANRVRLFADSALSTAPETAA